jgi:hypothetical protein
MNTRIATSCHDPDVIHMAVHEEDSTKSKKITVLSHDGETWTYPDGNRYVKYPGTETEVIVQQDSRWQLLDIQVRGDEVCILFLEDKYVPFVYCLRDGAWMELGGGKGGNDDALRIGEVTATGNLELLMPSGCDCPELSDVYFVICGQAGSDHFSHVSATTREEVDGNWWKYATVSWYYVDNQRLNPEKKWKPLGGTQSLPVVAAGRNLPSDSSDPSRDHITSFVSTSAHLAIPRVGNFACHLHATVLEEDATSGEQHLRFARFNAKDREDLEGGSWSVVASVTTTSPGHATRGGVASTTTTTGSDDGVRTSKVAGVGVSDFVFANGIPAVAWVGHPQGDMNNSFPFAYLSVWPDYTNAASTDRDQFVVTGTANNNGAIPSARSKYSKGGTVGSISLDSHGDTVWAQVSDYFVSNSSHEGDNRNKGDDEFQRKIFISSIDVRNPDAGWVEHAPQEGSSGRGGDSAMLLPHPHPAREACRPEDNARLTQLGAHGGHLRVACNGDLLVSHVVEKSSIGSGGSRNVAALARNGPGPQSCKLRGGARSPTFRGFFGFSLF